MVLPAAFGSLIVLLLRRIFPENILPHPTPAPGQCIPPAPPTSILLPLFSLPDFWISTSCNLYCTRPTSSGAMLHILQRRGPLLLLIPQLVTFPSQLVITIIHTSN